MLARDRFRHARITWAPWRAKDLAVSKPAAWREEGEQEDEEEEEGQTERDRQTDGHRHGEGRDRKRVTL